MKNFISPKMVISMPFAVIFAALLFFINETNFQKSELATEKIEEARRTLTGLNKVMQHMIDAEAGQYRYLLTGDAKYLEPYQDATQDMQQTLDDMRPLLAPYPEDVADFATIESNVAGKLSEMGLSVRMRKENKDEAWKFVLTTDVGLVHMTVIREKIRKLIASSANKVLLAKVQINDSLLLSRITIALLSMVGLLSFYMYLRQTNVLLQTGSREQASLQRERDQVTSLVIERTTNLAQLATYLQNVREDERGHLARELHDELGGLFTAMKLEFARVRRVPDLPKGMQDRVESIERRLNDGIAFKRRIVENLRPSALEQMGLMTSVSLLCRDSAQALGIPVREALEPVAVAREVELTIYRLVQESLTNVGKYARASKTAVTIDALAEGVRVCVEDDGIGFDPARVASGLHGLLGMRYRVESHGGTMRVESAPGRGTRIVVMLPGKLSEG